MDILNYLLKPAHFLRVCSNLRPLYWQSRGTSQTVSISILQNAVLYCFDRCSPGLGCRHDFEVSKSHTIRNTTHTKLFRTSPSDT